MLTPTLVSRVRDEIILGGRSMPIKPAILRKPSKDHVPSTVLRINQRATLGRIVILCSNSKIKLIRITKVAAAV